MENFPIDKLLHDYISGRITPEQLEQLEAWGRESEENRQILDLIDGNSDLGNELSRMYRYDKERVWKAICEEDRRYMHRRRLFRTLRTAAAAVVLIGMFVSGALLYKARERMDPSRNHIVATVQPGMRRALLEFPDGAFVPLGDSLRSDADHSQRIARIAELRRPRCLQPTAASEKLRSVSKRSAAATEASTYSYTVRVPRGSEYSMTLSDGTRVWLNAGSSISYPLHFGAERRVTVRGEVFFEVAHDAEHPFIVTAKGAEMTVLGTSFNVAAYDNEQQVETTLVTGSLRVNAPHGEVLLSPGEQATLDIASGEVDVQQVDLEVYTMWRRGLLVFYDEPLRNICRKLERWYNVKIDTSSPSLDGVLYTGMIKRHETLNTIADLMNLTNDVVFTQDDDGVIRVVRRSRFRPEAGI